jgi:hypothetical protein
MTNPFEALAIDDDEEDTQRVPIEKVKRTHQEKKNYKKQQENEKKPETVVTESYPERVKENAKEIRNNRAPPTPQTKKLGEGHYLDRQSGTGRV